MDQLIARAQLAQTFLTHVLNCPTDHPTRERGTMTTTLDRLIDGTTLDQLAAGHA